MLGAELPSHVFNPDNQVYHSPHIWQTSGSSREFLKIENEQTKTAQKIHVDKKLREIT